MSIWRALLQSCLFIATVSAWSAPKPQKSHAQCLADQWSKAVGSAVFVGLLSTSPVYADQIGVEKEAPTLYTGETVEV